MNDDAGNKVSAAPLVVDCGTLGIAKWNNCKEISTETIPSHFLKKKSSPL
jgi:hypothetical protein